jgi:hypothetical protein
VKKCFTMTIFVLLFAVAAVAENEVPRYEAYLGFQYVRANQFNQNTGLGQAIGGFDMYGGDGQFVYNFSKWLGGVIDAGAVNKPNVAVLNAHIQNTTAFVYAGPRFYFHKGGRIHPFGEVLFGGAFRRVSTEVTALTSIDTPNIPVVNPTGLFPGPLTVVNARLAASENAFSMKIGGGFDWRLNKRFSFRPLEIDYVLTRFPSLSTGTRENQNSIAASAGVIFTFGEQ